MRSSSFKLLPMVLVFSSAFLVACGSDDSTGAEPVVKPTEKVEVPVEPTPVAPLESISEEVLTGIDPVQVTPDNVDELFSHISKEKWDELDVVTLPEAPIQEALKSSDEKKVAQAKRLVAGVRNIANSVAELEAPEAMLEIDYNVYQEIVSDETASSFSHWSEIVNQVIQHVRQNRDELYNTAQAFKVPVRYLDAEQGVASVNYYEQGDGVVLDVSFKSELLASNFTVKTSLSAWQLYRLEASRYPYIYDDKFSFSLEGFVKDEINNVEILIEELNLALSFNQTQYIRVYSLDNTYYQAQLQDNLLASLTDLDFNGNVVIKRNGAAFLGKVQLHFAELTQDARRGKSLVALDLFNVQGEFSYDGFTAQAGVKLDIYDAENFDSIAMVKGDWKRSGQIYISMTAEERIEEIDLYNLIVATRPSLARYTFEQFTFSVNYSGHYASYNGEERSYIDANYMIDEAYESESYFLKGSASLTTGLKIKGQPNIKATVEFERTQLNSGTASLYLKLGDQVLKVSTDITQDQDIKTISKIKVQNEKQAQLHFNITAYQNKENDLGTIVVSNKTVATLTYYKGVIKITYIDGSFESLQ